MIRGACHFIKGDQKRHVYWDDILRICEGNKGMSYVDMWQNISPVKEAQGSQDGNMLSY